MINQVQASDAFSVVQEHVSLNPGHIWYVDSARPDDAGVANIPETAKKTIAAAISAAAAGDTIAVKAGVYDENNLDLSKDGLKLECELGTILTNTTGGATEALTVSADFCRVHLLSIVQPGIKGIYVTGDACNLDVMEVVGATVSFEIVGNRPYINTVRSTQHTVTGFDIQSAYGSYLVCHSIGSGGSTRGFYLSDAAADGNAFENCFSVGNGISPFEIVSGCTLNSIHDFSSGAGDGPRIDVGQINVWSNYLFQEIATSQASLDASNETKSYNVAQIYGSVLMREVHITVVSALSPSVEDFYLDIWDGSTSIPISKTTTLSLGSAPVGSLITRLKDSSEVLVYKSGSTCFITESVGYKSPQTEVILSQKGDGTDTFLRMTYTTTDTPSSGVIRGFFRWAPITTDGFVKVL